MGPSVMVGMVGMAITESIIGNTPNEAMTNELLDVMCVQNMKSWDENDI